MCVYVLDFFTNMCSVLLPSAWFQAVLLLHPIARKQNSRRVSGEMLSVTFGVKSSVAVMAREGSIDGVMRFIVFCNWKWDLEGFVLLFEFLILPVMSGFL